MPIGVILGSAATAGRIATSADSAVARRARRPSRSASRRRGSRRPASAARDHLGVDAASGAACPDVDQPRLRERLDEALGHRVGTRPRRHAGRRRAALRRLLVELARPRPRAAAAPGPADTSRRPVGVALDPGVGDRPAPPSTSAITSVGHTPELRHAAAGLPLRPAPDVVVEPEAAAPAQRSMHQRLVETAVRDQIPAVCRRTARSSKRNVSIEPSRSAATLRPQGQAQLSTGRRAGVDVGVACCAGAAPSSRTASTSALSRGRDAVEVAGGGSASGRSGTPRQARSEA